MISQTEIHDLVDRHVKYLEETRGRWKRLALKRKRAKVIDSTEIGNGIGYSKDKTITETGRAYPHYSFLTRAVFRPDPIIIDDKEFYLEVKGYGSDGRYLYPYNHCEGDLFYGMYFDMAKKEFDFLKIAGKFKGFIAQKAVALMRFSKEDFVKYCFSGLADILKHCREDESLGKTETEIRRRLIEAYESGGFDRVRDISNPVLEKGFVAPSRLDPFKEVDLERGAGYLVRATRTPFRIGSGKELGVKREDLDEAAYEGGRLYRRLLQDGLLHLVPSIGNITIAGELMDFEDVEKVSSVDEIRKLWKFYAEYYKKDAKLDTFFDFLIFTFGDLSLRNFSSSFLKGTNLGETPQKVSKGIIEMHESSLRPLLEEIVT